jgi:hypothetical protein
LALSGGGDRRELRPLRRDGNVDHDLAGHTVVGNHKGQYAAFNIVDPRPGTVHQHSTRREVLGCKQRGWWIADPETDGKMACEVMQDYVSDSGHPVDTAGGPYSEYVHMVTTEENFRRLMDEHLAESRSQLSPAGIGYLENVSEDEFAMSRNAQGRNVPTRWASKDHGITIVEGDRTIEHLAPRGILREEDL